MKNTELNAWFDAHPFGTLRDSEGDLWRRDANGRYLLRGNTAWYTPFFWFDYLTFDVVSDGSRLDSAQATDWLRAHQDETLTDTDGDNWRAKGDGGFIVTNRRGSCCWPDDPSNYSNLRWLPPGAEAKTEATPAVMNWSQAVEWMRAHPGEAFVDGTGYQFRVVAAEPAQITTIGTAIDWLIAHPGEMLVDDAGDLWRLNGTTLECQDKANGKLDFAAACLDQDVVSSWLPFVAPAKPALPAGYMWVEDSEGKPCVRMGTGYLSVDSDDEAAVLEALAQEYRARRAK